MRILILMALGSPWSASLAKTIARRGHAVHVCDFRNGVLGSFRPSASDVESDGAAYAGTHMLPSMGTGNMRYVLAAPRLRRLARDLRADIVLTLYGGGFGLMAYLSGVRPYAVYVVGSDVLAARGLNARINGIVLTAASHVFANGEFLAQRTTQQAPAATVETLLLGVDISLLPRCDHEGPLRIINTRSFGPVYNNESILHALARLPEDVPDFECVFTSGGPSLSAAMEIADRVLPGRLRKRVVFLGGGLPYQRILDELGRSHIYVSMSRSDGTATSTLEAMGAGLYPILSDIPANHPLVQPGASNGTLVPVDDIPALGVAILDAITNRATCARQADANRSLIKDMADADVNRARLIQRLESLVRTPAFMEG